MTKAVASTASAAPRKLSGIALLMAVDALMERALLDATSRDPKVQEAARRRLESVEAFALAELAGAVGPR